MAEVAHDNRKGEIFTCFITQYFTEETADSNVSTEPLNSTGLWHLVPVRYRTKGKLSLFLLSLTRRGGERRGVHVPSLSQQWLKSVFKTASVHVLNHRTNYFYIVRGNDLMYKQVNFFLQCVNNSTQRHAHGNTLLNNTFPHLMSYVPYETQLQQACC